MGQVEKFAARAMMGGICDPNDPDSEPRIAANECFELIWRFNLCNYQLKDPLQGHGQRWRVSDAGNFSENLFLIQNMYIHSTVLPTASRIKRS